MVACLSSPPPTMVGGAWGRVGSTIARPPEHARHTSGVGWTTNDVIRWREARQAVRRGGGPATAAR
jgi:hypothetical protein